MKQIELKYVLPERPKVKVWRETPASLEHGPQILTPPFLATFEGQPAILALDDVVNGNEFFKLCASLDYYEADRSAGMVTRSRTFGYNPRHAVRRNYCNASSLNHAYPEAWQWLKRAAELIASRYREALPQAFAEHEAAVEKVLPQWRVGKTPFTSGIINQSATLPYHRDSGNFDDKWSCMLVAKQFSVGGEVIFPEFGVSMEVKTGGLYMFDGQKWLHGVAPIRKTRMDGARYSCVFYSLSRMWQCGTGEQELARIRRVKTEKERKRAGI